MELEHRFEVPAGVDATWEFMQDLERVGRCLPGVELNHIDDNRFSGQAIIKIGPVKFTYLGAGRIIDKDPAAYRVRIETTGVADRQDARSGSEVAMLTTATVSALTTNRTAVHLATTLSLTGRPAQFGRAVMVDLGDKLVAEFARRIETGLAHGPMTGFDVSADKAVSPTAVDEVLPAPIPELNLTDLTEQIRSPGNLDYDQQRKMVGQLEAALSSADSDHVRMATNVGRELSNRYDMFLDLRARLSTAIDGLDAPNGESGPHLPQAAGGVFISYRRDESSFPASWLSTQLSAHLGPDRVFMDVDSLEPGDDFVEAINAAVGSCQVLIAIIGQHWNKATDNSGRRRLDRSADYVRLEIEAALTRNVRVIPVLTERAIMPDGEELPESLRALTRRHAIELNANRFAADVATLIKVIDKTLQ